MPKYRLLKPSGNLTNHRLTIQSNGRIFFSRSIEKELNIKQYKAVELTTDEENPDGKELFLRFVRKYNNPDYTKLNVSGNYYYFVSQKLLDLFNLRKPTFKNYYFSFEEFENIDKKRYKLELKKKKLAK